MTTADERQKALLHWLRRKPLLLTRTTSEIAQKAGRSYASDDDKALYKTGLGREGSGYARYSLCRVDLNKLAQDGSIEKGQSYPAEWRVL